MPGTPSDPAAASGSAPKQTEDLYAREMVGQAHPPDWRNPRAAAGYDLVVVGGGTAGLVAAAGGAGLGARVALVERALLGGDCLVHGCVPSKALLRSARAWHEVAQGGEHGTPEVSGPGNFATAMARMRRLRAEISHHNGASRLAALGIDVFFGAASFVAADAVEVAGQRLRFRRALIATGARPQKPDLPGLDEAEALTSATVFSLEELPQRLAIVGGGPMGCELAQVFARFGSEVSLVQRADQLLPRDDPDAAEVVRAALEADGVRCHLGTEVSAVQTRDGEHRLHLGPRGEGAGEELTADRILVATGRRPNVEGLGLEAAGVEYDARGVATDDYLRTTNRRIFAAGDVLGGQQFTHAADAQARLVLRNALFPLGRRRNSRLVVPWCTYTSPELAHVGIDARAAREQGLELDTLTLPLERTDRAILDGSTAGFLRLHLLQGSDEILGATLVADQAGEVLATLSLALTQGLGLRALASTIFPYPTLAEILKRAADDHARHRLAPWVRRALRRYFAWRR